MIIIQTVTSQGHQVHLAPQELLVQEESLDLEDDQDSQDLLGSKDHPVKEVRRLYCGHGAGAAREAVCSLYHVRLGSPARPLGLPEGHW